MSKTIKNVRVREKIKERHFLLCSFFLIKLTSPLGLNHYRRHFHVQLKMKNIVREREMEEDCEDLLSFSRRSARIFIIFCAKVSWAPGLDSPVD